MQDASSLRLRLLGEIEAFRAGAPLALPASRKTRALLAYLAATGTSHRRERLCSLFWDVPDDPKGSLRWSLSKLRGVLDESGRPRVLADRAAVRLDLADVDVDLFRLRRYVAHAFEGAGTDDLEALAQAGLGEFCEGLELPRCDGFQTWCVAMREDVRQMQLSLLRELAVRLRSTPERALPFARALVDLDPLDDSARIDLTETLVRAGRAEEAELQRQIGVQVLHESQVAVPAALVRTIRPVAAGSTAALRQHTRFCNAADGTSLAYSCVGSGPVLVKTANWLNHLEYEWDSPIWRHWLRELSRDHMLLRYDERGNGLSDWDVENLSFEAFVDDLGTVVDAAGVESFDLLGISQGCAVAIAYAVRHPERVRRLVLIGGYAMGWAVRSTPEEAARRQAMITLTAAGWGQANPAFRQMFTTLYFPEATAEEADWFNELQRVSTSPDGAQRLQRVFGEIDVRALAPQVMAPTLVAHARDDAMIPFESGRWLAQRIPDARFVALDSRNHLLLEHEPCWPVFLAELRRFLAE